MKLVFHHRSYCRGYVSVKRDESPVPYKGQFGTGYTVKRHNPKSTRYCFIDYYIQKENEK